MFLDFWPYKYYNTYVKLKNKLIHNINILGGKKV